MTDANLWTSWAVGICSWYVRKYTCAIFLALLTNNLKNVHRFSDNYDMNTKYIEAMS